MSRFLPLCCGLVLLCTVVGADRAGDAEADAVKEIKKYKGKVKVDDKSPNMPVIGVDVNHLQFTDADMKVLSAFVHLQELNISGNSITDKGLDPLTGLKKLRKLSLLLTKVTDAGLKKVAVHKELQDLNLNHTPVTDKGLKELAPLQDLRGLWLGRTKITDEGMKEVASFKHLQRLDLGRTEVTDKGLKELEGLLELQEIWLDETKVSNDGVKSLQKVLPKCKVHR
jgi:internalin A